MLNKKIGCGVLIAFSAFFVSAHSLAQPKFAIAGVGSTSCGQYLKPPGLKKEMSDLIMATWIQGFLSGTNAQRLFDTDTKMKLQPDAESIIAFVDNFCRENPLKTVFEASLALDISY